MSDRTRGIAFACGTAVISGAAVFLNARGVRAAGDATVYTTAKNLVAAGVLVLVALAGPRVPGRPGPHVAPGRLFGLVAVGVIGGSVPFVLFFEGLSRASSVHAAFLHKTMLIWVAVLALLLLGERLGPSHIAAIALLIGGMAVADGGLGGFRFGDGEVLVIAATLLWSAEVILAKRLLAELAPATLGVARMVLGGLVLIGWVALSGRWPALTGMDSRAWWWVALTGVILAGYVATWFTALSLAPAVDVTAVLSLGALVTVAMTAVDDGALPSRDQTAGLSMLVAGAVLLVAARRGRAAGGAA